MQQVWLSASNPTFSIHCKHLKSTCLVGQERRIFPVAWLSHPKSVHSVKTDTSMAWIKKNQSSPHKKAYWTRTMSCGQPFRYRSTNLQTGHCLFRLSFHVLGKGVCLVMLWPIPARRDKPWNYIPLEFQRYTKLILATGNLYGHVENV